jgi:carbonic anhydrase/acetyltransferase-like protein (isoleucine patch superfamily)
MSIEQYQDITPKVGKGAFIHSSAILIGDLVLGSDCSVWPHVVIRGDVNKIVIGNSTNIQDGSVLHVTHKRDDNNPGYPLTIGNRVTVGHKALLHGCTIGDDVLVGMGAIVMDGVLVQDKVMIAAGSLVSPGKTLESGYLYRGQPAVQVRKLTNDELDFLTYSAKHYMKLKNNYLSSVKNQVFAAPH